jgi:hypothetical protein
MANLNTTVNYPCIYYQNVRGLRSKTLTFYRNLSLATYDIIVLTESWLVDGIRDSELFDDRYVVWRRDRDLSVTGQSRGGGVIIATRKELAVTPQPSFHSSAEDLWLTISLKDSSNRSIKVHLCVLYLCKQGQGFSFSQQLENFLSKLNHVVLSNPNDKILLIGDFNMSNITWLVGASSLIPTTYTSVDECNLVDDLITHSLCQYNGVLNVYGKLLDLVLSNDIVSVGECMSPLVPIDPYHKPLIIHIKYTIIDFMDPAPRMKYIYNKSDYAAINEELVSIDWEGEFSERTLDQSLGFFYDIFIKLRNKYIPCRKIKAESYPAWFSLPLKKAIKEKYKYLKKYSIYNNISDLVSFNLLRDRVRRLEQECFAAYINRTEDNIAKNPKQFWSFIKSRSGSHAIPSSLKYGDGLVNTGTDICNAFSDYFRTSFSTPSSNNLQTSLSPSSDSPVSLSSIEVNPDEILNILLKLDPAKSAGPDDLPACFLINCAKSLVVPVTLLFKRSFSEYSVPSLWKSAYITPVHKKGLKTHIVNYRPISKLCILSKVLEKVVYNQVYEALKNSFSPNQHGFLRRRSTVSNLILMNEYVTEAMDSGYQVDVIYTDYSKAFDRIDHAMLLSKLYNIGISGDLLRWFSSYIDNRSQAVVVNNYMSGWVAVPSGVPQGSLLGPLLFNIFINDISKCIIHSELLCFADDMKIYRKLKSSQDSVLIQSDLARLDDYCQTNKLDLNPSKCFSVTFSRKRNLISSTYILKGQSLNRVSFMKDLGVVHDSKLLFDLHIDGIVGSALRALGFIMRNSAHFTQAKTLKVLYCSLVRSKIEYASQIWNPCYTTYIDRIERIQKRFLKHLCFKLKCSYVSSNYLSTCKKHHILPLYKRREIADTTYILNITSGNIDCPDLLSKLSFNTPTRSKRHFPPISLKCTSSNYRQNSFLSRASRSLNSLSREIDIDVFNCSIPSVRRKLACRFFS